jgi:hypothetical protein
MKAPKPKSDYAPVSAGTHVARLYRIVHVGTVPDTFQDSRVKPRIARRDTGGTRRQYQAQQQTIQRNSFHIVRTVLLGLSAARRPRF